MYASGLAQSICIFSSPSFEVSNWYSHIPYRYSIKDDEACISTLIVITQLIHFYNQMCVQDLNVSKVSLP